MWCQGPKSMFPTQLRIMHRDSITAQSLALLWGRSSALLWTQSAALPWIKTHGSAMWQLSALLRDIPQLSCGP
jgi:hypothetical protein